MDPFDKDNKLYNKLGCVVRMVVDSILPHAECGPNDHQKDAPFRDRYYIINYMVLYNMKDIMDYGIWTLIIWPI